MRDKMEINMVAEPVFLLPWDRGVSTGLRINRRAQGTLWGPGVREETEVRGL